MPLTFEEWFDYVVKNHQAPTVLIISMGRLLELDHDRSNSFKDRLQRDASATVRQIMYNEGQLQNLQQLECNSSFAAGFDLLILINGSDSDISIIMQSSKVKTNPCRNILIC